MVHKLCETKSRSTRREAGSTSYKMHRIKEDKRELGGGALLKHAHWARRCVRVKPLTNNSYVHDKTDMHRGLLRVTFRCHR